MRSSRLDRAGAVPRPAGHLAPAGTAPPRAAGRRRRDQAGRGRPGAQAVGAPETVTSSARLVGGILRRLGSRSGSGMGPVAQPVFKTGAVVQPTAREVRLLRRSVNALPLAGQAEEQDVAAGLF